MRDGQPPGRGRARRRWPRPLLVVGLVAGLLGLAVSVTGVVVQIMPRTFSAAQRQQIMAWEVGKRWRTWPAGQIFPQVIRYRLPGQTFGSNSSLLLTARRVGIAKQASCKVAAQRAAAGVLAQHGCLAVLRATYEDATQTLAVTIGVAVLPGGSAAQQSARSLSDSGRPRWGIRAVSFRRTATARFGDGSQKLAWDGVAGPYLVLATVGYADGRPWLARGDTYTEAELLGLARGAGSRVASELATPAPVPRCPGSPAC